jgi:hypothetical protein
MAEAGKEDVDRAVRAARKAFDEGPWPRMTAKQRSRCARGRGELPGTGLPAPRLTQHFASPKSQGALWLWDLVLPAPPVQHRCKTSSSRLAAFPSSAPGGAAGLSRAAALPSSEV